ncbi:Haiku1-like [Thalictrum thalictroides]|uniref:Haiku1-like n=1 Tax=Thalictrum thalictroides TaxID=46969 RepID=A0A7J6UR70_THATH|nr:Haiku1-like [Thalictrum thalictroides]KAF5175029.1 Haiku1-like [Thalictrum thalictroides]
MNRSNNDHLGVNKMGKNIRKSPLHQPNFGNNNNKQQQQQHQQQQQQPPQPHVYNISKNDFRNIVQQLTGSPSHNQPPPRPPHNPPKPPSLRLQRIRPPPLTPIARPHHNPPPPAPVPAPPPFNNGFHRPPHIVQQPPYPSMPPGEGGWANTAESPISAYMRYLQNSMTDPSPRQFQGQNQPQPQPYPYPHPHPHPHSQGQVQPPMPGLLPTPPGTAAFPSPFPSPRGNGPALLPSPTSQFLLPSPSAYMNLLSPRSPYPLLSPGFQFPPPLTPSFFSPFSHSGILGPGPQQPPSPGMMFPPSPSGFFPISSPRWRGQ